jgi:hypothetical protein
MKKILILLITLLAFGLMFGCTNEITNDPENNIQPNSEVIDSELVGIWEGIDLQMQMIFDETGKHTHTVTYNGISSINTANYSINNNKIKLTNMTSNTVADLGVTDAELTYLIEDNKLTVITKSGDQDISMSFIRQGYTEPVDEEIPTLPDPYPLKSSKELSSGDMYYPKGDIQIEEAYFGSSMVFSVIISDLNSTQTAQANIELLKYQYPPVENFTINNKTIYRYKDGNYSGYYYSTSDKTILTLRDTPRDFIETYASQNLEPIIIKKPAIIEEPIIVEEPIIIEEPTPETCIENWTCTNWTNCANETQIRSCNDLENCGTNIDQPITQQACEMEPLAVLGQWYYKYDPTVLLMSESQMMNIEITETSFTVTDINQRITGPGIATITSIDDSKIDYNTQSTGLTYFTYEINDDELIIIAPNATSQIKFSKNYSYAEIELGLNSITPPDPYPHISSEELDANDMYFTKGDTQVKELYSGNPYPFSVIVSDLNSNETALANIELLKLHYPPVENFTINNKTIYAWQYDENNLDYYYASNNKTFLTFGAPRDFIEVYANQN